MKILKNKLDHHKEKLAKISDLWNSLLRRIPFFRPKETKSPKHLFFLIIASVGIVIGLIVAIVILNFTQRGEENYVEVTFITPRQALIFWKTEYDTKGYVKYGNSRWHRPNTEYQTSSQDSQVHAVVLEEVPLEGLYISMHNEADSFWYWSPAMHIKYQDELDDWE